MFTSNKFDSAVWMTLGGFCLLAVAKPFDIAVATAFCGALGQETSAVLRYASDPSLSLAFFRGLSCVAAGCLGFFCARLLKGPARMIAFFPVVGLTAAASLQWPGIVVPNLQVVSYIGYALIGFALGSVQAVLQEAQEQRRAQLVDSTLRNRELVETRLQLIKQDEIERKMLAADLHDQVLNDLKFLLRLVDTSKDSPNADFRSSASTRLEAAMDSIRKVMESLCPSDLEHIGLIAALEECLRDRADKAGFLPQFRSNVSEEEIEALSRTEKALLYRLAQESMTNIAKHAKAKKVRLSVAIEQSELWIQILDDGVGMPIAATDVKSRGLQYMNLRAEIIGARINWSPGTDGKGTAVDIRINLSGRKVSARTDS